MNEIPNHEIANSAQWWKEEYERLKAEIEALKLRTGICEWEYDEHHDVWETSCSNAWQFMNDGPKENECQYCMYCGGVIDALLTAEGKDDGQSNVRFEEMG